jgi:hypothetical protein
VKHFEQRDPRGCFRDLVTLKAVGGELVRRSEIAATTETAALPVVVTSGHRIRIRPFAYPGRDAERARAKHQKRGGGGFGNRINFFGARARGYGPTTRNYADVSWTMIRDEQISDRGC